MGNFLAVSGIANADVAAVAQALQTFAAERGGKFTLLGEDVAASDDTGTIAASAQGHVTVLYPDGCVVWDDASSYLSAALGQPVFSLHIHDSDLWMYLLFVNGEAVEQFNQWPDYWEEIDDEEMARWVGDAAAVAAHWPGVQAAQIAGYLVPLDPEAEEFPKAYPDDEFGAGEDWQMLDFMAKLGLTWVVDDDGKRLGPSFALQVRS